MIAVCGGSFNPPTKAHIEIIKKVGSLNYIDKTLILPVGDFYKKEDLISVNHRINMLNAIFKDMDNFIVSDLEAKFNKQLKTLESLQLLKEQYHKNDIAFVMGADNLIDIKTWYKYEKILSEFNFIVFDRDDLNALDIINNDEVLSKYRHKFFIERLNIENGISSTKVRTLIKEKKEYSKYLESNIYKYIKENELYK